MKQHKNTIENLVSVKVLGAIVKETGTLIQRDIVICNREGKIIAATQSQRIGVFSNQIKKMIESEDEVLFVEEEDDEQGFKPGINLLIRYEHAAVGTVGITGEPEEVKIFGKLIQAFVEQQIAYSKRERDKEDHRHLINNFLYSWIFDKTEDDDESSNIRGLSLGIDVNLPRVVCIVSIKNAIDLFDMQIQHQIERQIAEIDSRNLLTRFANELVFFMSCSDTESAHKAMLAVRELLYSQLERNCAIGIGCAVKNSSDIKMSYEAAKLACEASQNTEDKGIVVFGYNLELLISTASSACRQAIYNYVFRKYRDEKQIEESVCLIESYIGANRSIKRAGEALFMHENTIQSRLNKIYNLTCYNPRDTKDLTLLYAVAMMHKSGTRRTKS